MSISLSPFTPLFSPVFASQPTHLSLFTPLLFLSSLTLNRIPFYLAFSSHLSTCILFLFSCLLTNTFRLSLTYSPHSASLSVSLHTSPPLFLPSSFPSRLALSVASNSVFVACGRRKWRASKTQYKVTNKQTT